MTRRIQNLSAIALASILLAFHANLKHLADPQEINDAAKEVAKPRLWKGKVAPNFELTLRDGSKFNLADHVGREVVILNFFATWCRPCREETPELNRFSDISKGKPILLLGIDNNENAEVVNKYIHDLKVRFPVGIDAEAIAKQYGVTGLPTTVVINAQGLISLYESGMIANTDVAFGTEITDAVNDVQHHKGVTREQYLAAAKAETYFDVRTIEMSGGSDDVKLTGRAKQLAEKSPCVCGCSNTLAKCNCSVAKGMKKKLRDTKLDGTNDVKVMEDVNREFCMKAMS